MPFNLAPKITNNQGKHINDKVLPTMTVPYAADVPPTFSSLGWWKVVVLRWKGGIYKLILPELIIFTASYYFVWGMISGWEFKYNYLNEAVKSYRMYQTTIRIMLGFMLVYYYQEIYSRARRIFFSIPFPDSTFIAVNSCVGGLENLKEGMLLKKTIFRYILACTFQSYYASSRLFQQKYPKPWKSLVDLGILTENEVKRIRDRIEEYPYSGEVSFIPMAWACLALRRAFEEGHIYPNQQGKTHNARDKVYPTVVNVALKALHDYRLNYGSMLFEVYFPFPLLLSQLVTIVVYSYFLIALFAQQNLNTETIFFFPVFTCCEFVVYMGALRVGQTFTNPLGGDENAFEMVAFFNRNLRLAHLYGCYGPSERFDMIMNPLPLVDLTEIQSRNLYNIPLNFYETSVARNPVRSMGTTTNNDTFHGNTTNVVDIASSMDTSHIDGSDDMSRNLLVEK